MKPYFLTLLLFAFLISFTSNAGQPQQPEAPEKHRERKDPVQPEFDPSGPNIVMFLGGLVAGVTQINPWVALAIGVGIILITLILIALIDVDTLVPKRNNNVVAKVIGIILAAIFGLVLLCLAIAALVIGVAILVAALLSVTANPILGAAFIFMVGFTWLLIKAIVYGLRSIRYKRAIRKKNAVQ